MTSAYAKYLDTYARAIKGDEEAIGQVFEAGQAALAEFRRDMPARAEQIDAEAERELSSAIASAMVPLPVALEDKLTAIADAEEFNRRNLEACGMDPSRATELANAQRAALKGEAQP